ncbi:MAG: hypothetical protein WC325_13620 [Candidatus Bathyarchaeia archaeon]|jgi:ABC-type sugar transport system permease subunit
MNTRKIARLTIWAIFLIGVASMFYGLAIALISNNPFVGMPYVFTGCIPAVLTTPLIAKMVFK